MKDIFEPLGWIKRDDGNWYFGGIHDNWEYRAIPQGDRWLIEKFIGYAGQVPTTIAMYRGVIPDRPYLEMIMRSTSITI